jgi:hypothetical protein
MKRSNFKIIIFWHYYNCSGRFLFSVNDVECMDDMDDECDKDKKIYGYGGSMLLTLVILASPVLIVSLY